MPRLATELLTQIGVQLVLDSSDRQRAQKALACLSRASKDFHEVPSPLLYETVALRSEQHASRWAKTLNSRKALPRVEGSEQSGIRDFKPTQLFVLFPNRESNPYDLPISFYSANNRRTASLLPDLTQALSLGLFSQLSTLKLVNAFTGHAFLATLLGPEKPARKSIKLFTLYSSTLDKVIDPVELYFFLEVLEYFAQEKSGPGSGFDLEFCIQYNLDKNPRWNENQTVEAELVKEAHTVWPTFSGVINTDLVDWDGRSVEEYIRTPEVPNVSPWTSLRVLNLQLCSNPALALIFHSPAFPALRRLTLHGSTDEPYSIDRTILLTFRIAVNSLDVPGKLLEPQLDFESGDADVEWAGFGPPTQKELENYPYKPYRGPKLELLDASKLSIMLPW
ncbi:hypothetical protein JCM8097_007832 [Rhodosporidiobolus ruineniae]